MGAGSGAKWCAEKSRVVLRLDGLHKMKVPVEDEIVMGTLPRESW